MGFGGLELACWPLVPKFAVSSPAEAAEFLGLDGQFSYQSLFPRLYMNINYVSAGHDSVVGIATRYTLDSPGIVS